MRLRCQTGNPQLVAGDRGWVMRGTGLDSKRLVKKGRWAIFRLRFLQLAQLAGEVSQS